MEWIVDNSGREARKSFLYAVKSNKAPYISLASSLIDRFDLNLIVFRESDS